MRGAGLLPERFASIPPFHPLPAHPALPHPLSLLSYRLSRRPPFTNSFDRVLLGGRLGRFYFVTQRERPADVVGRSTFCVDNALVYRRSVVCHACTLFPQKRGCGNAALWWRCRRFAAVLRPYVCVVPLRNRRRPLSAPSSVPFSVFFPCLSFAVPSVTQEQCASVLPCACE